MIVWVRSGPVETKPICTPIRFEPATAPRTSGRGAVLAATFTNHLAQLSLAFQHLGGKRALADARRVGANNSENAGQVFRRETRADQRAADDRARRSHEGISP